MATERIRPPTCRFTPVEQTTAHIHDTLKLEWLDSQGRLRVSYFSTHEAAQRLIDRHGLVIGTARTGMSFQ